MRTRTEAIKTSRLESDIPVDVEASIFLGLLLESGRGGEEDLATKAGLDRMRRILESEVKKAVFGDSL